MAPSPIIPLLVSSKLGINRGEQQEQADSETESISLLTPSGPYSCTQQKRNTSSLSSTLHHHYSSTAVHESSRDDNGGIAVQSPDLSQTQPPDDEDFETRYWMKPPLDEEAEMKYQEAEFDKASITSSTTYMSEPLIPVGKLNTGRGSDKKVVTSIYNPSQSKLESSGSLQPALPQYELEESVPETQLSEPLIPVIIQDSKPKPGYNVQKKMSEKTATKGRNTSRAQSTSSSSQKSDLPNWSVQKDPQKHMASQKKSIASPKIRKEFYAFQQKHSHDMSTLSNIERLQGVSLRKLNDIKVQDSTMDNLRTEAAKFRGILNQMGKRNREEKEEITKIVKSGAAARAQKALLKQRLTMLTERQTKLLKVMASHKQMLSKLGFKQVSQVSQQSNKIATTKTDLFDDETVADRSGTKGSQKSTSSASSSASSAKSNSGWINTIQTKETGRQKSTPLKFGQGSIALDRFSSGESAIQNPEVLPKNLGLSTLEIAKKSTGTSGPSLQWISAYPTKVKGQETVDQLDEMIESNRQNPPEASFHRNTFDAGKSCSSAANRKLGSAQNKPALQNQPQLKIIAPAGSMPPCSLLGINNRPKVNQGTTLQVKACSRTQICKEVQVKPAAKFTVPVSAKAIPISHVINPAAPTQKSLTELAEPMSDMLKIKQVIKEQEGTRTKTIPAVVTAKPPTGKAFQGKIPFPKPLYKFSGFPKRPVAPSMTSDDSSVMSWKRQRFDATGQKKQSGEKKKKKKEKDSKLKQLVDQGILIPGNDVLKIVTDSKIFRATLLTDGRIQSSGGEIFQTPMSWCMAAIGGLKNVKVSYQKVFYKGQSLESFIPMLKDPPTSTTPELVVSTLGLNQDTDQGYPKINDSAEISCKPVKNDEQVGTHSTKNSITFDIVKLLTSCKLQLIEDEEIIPCSTLPKGFWETQELAAHIDWDFIDKW